MGHVYLIFDCPVHDKLGRINWEANISYHCHRNFYDRMVYLALYAFSIYHFIAMYL